MQFRTDLAIEAREIAGENTGGIEFKKYSENGLEISRLIVKNQKARQALGKEIGTYITIELPSLTDNFTETDKRLETVGNEIKRLLPVNVLVLVAGLGNMEITPDSLGPKTSRRVLATRHIGGEIARSTGLDRLRPVAVMQTGVTGQTGIETGEYILSIVRRIRPTAVVAIDALASRRTERLGCTLQISDTGISPGAGVGNHRTIPRNQEGKTITWQLGGHHLFSNTLQRQIKHRLSGREAFQPFRSHWHFKETHSSANTVRAFINQHHTASCDLIFKIIQN